MNTFVSTLSRMALGGAVRGLLIKNISGLDNIPQKSNFILASNHLSHSDWFMSGYITTPRRFTFLAQVDQYTGFKKMWRNLIYWWGGIIPINRKSDESKKQAVATAIKMLKEGYCVVIYPEGGRAYDGVMREFKSGVGMLHLESGIPVLPAAFFGTREVFPPHGKIKIKKIVRVNIGRPLDFPKERAIAAKLDKHSRAYHGLCADVSKKIEEEVRALLGEIEN
jgi:1-acyl-sn-glycerol-3-phosphate acyltransferase